MLAISHMQTELLLIVKQSNLFNVFVSTTVVSKIINSRLIVMLYADIENDNFFDFIFIMNFFQSCMYFP